ncbi:MAG: hypothetical protein GY822_01000, partial [Deltaproteobacteria bacterium]|nr:hypothetical protein [Deltaproteobacteria bacterium]
EQMDPLLMMLLMQSMGSPSIGSVNGQQLQMDPMAFATMQMFASAINPRPTRVVRQVNTPLHVLPPVPPTP